MQKSNKAASTLFLITARGGSKGVPRKNILEIAGIPLIAYKIIAAQQANLEKRIIVSTDDEEIAQVARKWGGEDIVPFIRPDFLATDTASSMDVVEHAMKWVEANEKKKYDYVCLLEPSSPFATAKDLEKAHEFIVKADADTLLSMKEVEVNTCFIHELDSNGGLSFFYNSIKDLNSARRQDQKKEYTPNGCMYIARWDYFERNKLFHSVRSIPYIMDERYSIEIDSIEQLEYTRYLVNTERINIGFWKENIVK